MRCFLILFISLICVHSYARAQTPDLVFARDRVVQRLADLQNLTAQVDAVLTYLPSRALTRPIGISLEGAWGYSLSFRFLDGRAVYDWRYDQATAEQARQRLGLGDVCRQLAVFSHERAETLDQRFNDEPGLGTITDSATLPTDHPIDIALGLRHYGQEGWLTPQMLQDAVLSRTASGTIALVLDTPPGSAGGRSTLRHTWEFDPNNGYAMVEYRASTVGASFAFAQIVCSDFKAIGTVSLPYTIEYRRFSIAGGQGVHPILNERMRVMHYLLNDPENTPESYVLNWPGHSFLKDMRTGELFKPATTRPITDAEIIAKAQRRLSLSDTEGTRAKMVGLVVSCLAVLCVLALWLRHRKLSGR